MNKAFKVIYAALFFGVCAAPLIAMPFAASNEQIEKRELAKAPQIVEDGALNTSFSEEAEAWYNDRLPFRAKLLEASSLIKSEVFKAPTANVISGSDGWLFFGGDEGDYIGSDIMSDYQLDCTAVTLSLIEENVKGKGGKFLFVPMPNKSQVYDEYMPANYIKADENNYSKLLDRLNGLGVTTLDMKQIMRDNKSAGIYHKRDTHWNYLGALIGYNAIMDGLSHPHKTYDSASYNITNDWQGDLEKLLYPDNAGYDEQYRFDIEYDEFRFTMPPNAKDTQASLELFMSDKEQGDTRIRTQKIKPTGAGSLYMVRDSFGRALLPFMIDNYDTAFFERRTSPNMTSVAQNGDMVYEVVERNIKNITLTAPIMPAPKRELTDYTGDYAADGNKAFIKEENGYTHIYGTLDDNFAGDDARVYIQLACGGEQLTFEAFPIVEKDLLKAEGIEDAKYGFSAYIDTSSLDGGYDIHVISDKMKSVTLETLVFANKGDETQ